MKRKTKKEKKKLSSREKLEKGKERKYVGNSDTFTQIINEKKKMNTEFMLETCSVLCCVLFANKFAY